jgi:hypothetical protein
MSFNQKKVINEVNKLLKIYFPESNLQLIGKNNGFALSGNATSKAINNYEKNNTEGITVIQWFDNFWIYVDINLRYNESRRNNFPNIFASISIFQGDKTDNIKNQLFRAEWDNYRDPNQKHPQPHWHIYPVQYHHQSFKEFLEATKATKEFAEFLSKAQDVIEIKKIHFAMNGQWANQVSHTSHTHEINDEKSLVNWLIGLLEHIETQLRYAAQN